MNARRKEKRRLEIAMMRSWADMMNTMQDIYDNPELVEKGVSVMPIAARFEDAARMWLKINRMDARIREENKKESNA